MQSHQALITIKTFADWNATLILFINFFTVLIRLLHFWQNSNHIFIRHHPHSVFQLRFSFLPCSKKLVSVLLTIIQLHLPSTKSRYFQLWSWTIRCSQQLVSHTHNRSTWGPCSYSWSPFPVSNITGINLLAYRTIVFNSITNFAGHDELRFWRHFDATIRPTWDILPGLISLEWLSMCPRLHSASSIARCAQGWFLY